MKFSSFTAVCQSSLQIFIAPHDSLAFMGGEHARRAEGKINANLFAKYPPAASSPLCSISAVLSHRQDVHYVTGLDIEHISAGIVARPSGTTAL